MSVLVLFAALGTAPPLPGSELPVSSEAQKEIVVIGERMERWKGGLTKVDGTVTCRTKTSTGDELIDAIRCGSMLLCIGPMEAQIDVIMASDRDSDSKREAVAELTRPAIPCMDDYHREAIRRLAVTRTTSK